jgi:ethanolamine utilization microcompartment shell protein EutL
MKTKMMPLFAALAALMATPVLADDLVFTVTNNTSDTLVELYASPSNEDNWGADIMAGQQLAAGEAGEVTIVDGSDQCAYDLRMIFASGEALEGSDDICGGSVTIN